jgi:hypothetical protein
MTGQFVVVCCCTTSQSGMIEVDSRRQLRHCEKRSDEAIQSFLAALDCFASLAMTELVAPI